MEAWIHSGAKLVSDPIKSSSAPPPIPIQVISANKRSQKSLDK